MALVIPGGLIASCRQTPERSDWLARLPAIVRELRQQWSLTIGTPLEIDHERVRLWTFARIAAGPHDNWRQNTLVEVARNIARDLNG
jgi:hypothetical protein